jgi:flagellar hook-basal body complex protein FliE
MSAIDAIVAPAIAPEQAPPTNTAAPAPEASVPQSFGDLLTRGLDDLEAKVAHADQLVAAFAVDDSIPVHQVTIALQEARLSVELMMQMRSRLVESYRDIMNMQI